MIHQVLYTVTVAQSEATLRSSSQIVPQVRGHISRQAAQPRERVFCNLGYGSARPRKLLTNSSPSRLNLRSFPVEKTSRPEHVWIFS